jgi:hypothetical protein
VALRYRRPDLTDPRRIAKVVAPIAIEVESLADNVDKLGRAATRVEAKGETSPAASR